MGLLRQALPVSWSPRFEARSVMSKQPAASQHRSGESSDAPPLSTGVGVFEISPFSGPWLCEGAVLVVPTISNATSNALHAVCRVEFMPKLPVSAYETPSGTLGATAKAPLLPRPRPVSLTM
jgi:hypothetical protein